MERPFFRRTWVLVLIGVLVNYKLDKEYPAIMQELVQREALGEM